ncbi:MAG: hypothetical protein ACUZ9M_00850 [Candidatus Scalindua sp.]
MRRKPYTKTGIRRVPCMRCGEPSGQQWQICALNNQWAGVCTECDIKLNRMVLQFMKIPSKEVYCLIDEYKSRAIE